MSEVTLGLDLGPNSIGWALIDEEHERIVDIGVRVFPEGVDNFDSAKEVSRNETVESPAECGAKPNAVRYANAG
jgi:CRISPR/Cas system Type II protein with McrA/HNH and RuvC-like nuclease domain